MMVPARSFCHDPCRKVVTGPVACGTHVQDDPCVSIDGRYQKGKRELRSDRNEPVVGLYNVITDRASGISRICKYTI